MNDSKKNDPRFWKKWEKNGAVRKIDSQHNNQAMLSGLINMYDEKQSLFQEEYIKDNFEFGKNYLSTKPVFECPEEKIDQYLSLTKQIGDNYE